MNTGMAACCPPNYLYHNYACIQCATSCPAEQYKQSCFCANCTARCRQGFWEVTPCTFTTNRVCKELETNVSLGLALNVQSINLTGAQVAGYGTAVANSMGVSPAYASASLQADLLQANLRRRLLQTTYSVYVSINMPASNFTVAFANFSTNSTNITSVAESVLADLKSDAAQSRIAQACQNAQLVVAELDEQSLTYSIVVQFPPNCPEGAYCIGSDVTNCTRFCPPGTYKTKDCYPLGDTVCTPCPAQSFCPGNNLFYRCSTCDNEVYETSACTATTDRICTPCRPDCTGETYETTQCTNTTNRVCSNCTWCSPGQYASAPCTSLTNRQCKACASSYYCPGNNSFLKCSSCKPRTYQTSSCGPVLDRGCTACREACANETYETTPCSLYSNRKCSPCTQACAPGLHESQQCSATTDRTCTLCEGPYYCPDGREDLLCGTCQAGRMGLVMFEFGIGL